MSRLVQLWEQGYVFQEDELGFFAQSQKDLSQTFIVPKMSSSTKSCYSWVSEQIALSIQKKYHSSNDEINHEARFLEEKLKRRIETSEKLIQILEELGGRVMNLQESHEKVKSKSLVMQSLWDGLVIKQADFTQILEELKKTLDPYLDYETLYKILLLPKEGQDCLSSSFCDSFQKASFYLATLQRTPQHLDAPLYTQRYRQIIESSSKTLLSAILLELSNVTKLSSVRFRDDATLIVLADVNADFLVSSMKLSSAMRVLGESTESYKELSESTVQIASKYFSCRSSLLHYFFANYAKDLKPEESLLSLIELVHHVLKEERTIAEKLFGDLLPSFSIQYKQFVEAFLVPVLRRIRSVYDSCDLPDVAKSTALEAITKVKTPRPLNEDQRRVLGILNDFFTNN